MKRFFIISGGKIEDAFAKAVLNGVAEKTVIAADSGMEFLRRNEIIPQIIIGDFDSVSSGTLEWFQKKDDIIWHKLNPVKDDTDTESAIRLAISMGAELITVLGGTGSRLDHVLGNISLLGIGLESGTDICIIDTNNRIRMADKPVTIEKSAQYGRFVSLIAVTDDNEVSLKGFKYPVTDYSFDRFTSLGISNEIVDDQAVVDIHRGKFIIIESKD